MKKCELKCKNLSDVNLPNTLKQETMELTTEDKLVLKFGKEGI